jgi:hypothetical protein
MAQCLPILWIDKKAVHRAAKLETILLPQATLNTSNKSPIVKITGFSKAC